MAFERFFQFFHPNHVEKRHKSTKFYMDFRLVEINIAEQIIFFLFFGLDPILSKKLTKIFYHPNVIIYATIESPWQI
jgi:hypothetical protein